MFRLLLLCITIIEEIQTSRALKSIVDSYSLKKPAEFVNHIKIGSGPSVSRFSLKK